MADRHHGVPAVFDVQPVHDEHGHRLAEWAICTTCGWVSDQLAEPALGVALRRHATEEHAGRERDRPS